MGLGFESQRDHRKPSATRKVFSFSGGTLKARDKSAEVGINNIFWGIEEYLLFCVLKNE